MVSPKHLARFSASERDYIKTMRKRQKLSLSTILDKRDDVVLDVPLRLQVLQSRLPDRVKLDLFEELKSHADRDAKFVEWVRKIVRLPLGVLHRNKAMMSSSAFLLEAQRRLDEGCEGHGEAKREVLKTLCQSRHANGSFALGLEGPPGTGKTHFVKHALVPALGRPYVCIPLGGMSDASVLLGCSYSYEGSREGRLASALMDAGCCDPIIHFDEVDKLPKSAKGSEIESVLIHLIDPTEPCLQDKYFHGIDIDYSRCVFVLGYNDPDAISPVLLDRVKRIRMGAPNAKQREAIVLKHILPRVATRYDGAASQQLSPGAIGRILQGVTAGEGMRGIEQRVEHVIASAVLCGRLQQGPACVGVADAVPIYDAEGLVTEAFTRNLLDAHEGKPFETRDVLLRMYS